MSATNYTPIQLYRSTTAAAVPSAASLAAGELAINLTDEKLYFKNAGGTVTLLASSASASNVGTVTSVSGTGTVNGLTLTGSVTSSGSLTLGGTLSVDLSTATVTGTLPVSKGGTGTATQFTAGSVVFAGASGVYSQDNANLFWDDTNNRLGIGTSAPGSKLDILAQDAVRVTGFQPFQTWRDSNDANKGFRIQTAGGNTLFANDATGGGTYTERMRIDSAGNVGIGLSTPSDKLHVYSGSQGTATFEGFYSFGDGNYNIRLKNDGSTYGYLSQNPASGGIVVANGMRYYGGGPWIPDSTTASSLQQLNGNFIFTSDTGLTGGVNFAPTERARIDSSGNLLVGTTTLGGAGGWGVDPIGIEGAPILLWNRTSRTTTSYPAIFRNGGTDVGFITYTNTAVAYNTTSDARLKENIADADDAAALIDAIQVRKFDWKADGSHQRYGFVAQELVEVAPEAVHQSEDPEATMAVDYSKLVPMLVKEIQSLRARVAQLEGN